MKQNQKHGIGEQKQIMSNSNPSNQLTQSVIKSCINAQSKQSSQTQSNIAKTASSSCSSPREFIKHELLRLILIPLLIVLFLLTIALTFKQNSYQTNDYFYSKNIEINRKIRGVVPPLNESKQEVFGEYKIGLVQKFNISNRRMFQNLNIKIHLNQTMLISQFNRPDCYSLYRLRFYSSTIFIELLESNLDHGSTKSQESYKGDPASQTSICSAQLWTKLNQILNESHIWTFAEGNFYLLQFSQLGDESNGVLILHMLQKYSQF